MKAGVPSRGARAEASLDRQFAELDHLYQTAPVGLCMLDRELRYVRINERLARLGGKPVAEHLGRTMREVVGDLAVKLEPALLGVVETGEPVLNLELESEDPVSGRKHYWLNNYYPLRSEDGTVEGVSCVVQEVTEAKRAEEALRQAHEQVERLVEERTRELQETNQKLRSEIAARTLAEEALRADEERYRRLLESTNVIPWEADAESWLFTYVGPQAVKVLGHPLEQWYEADFWASHIHPDDREWAMEFCMSSSQKCTDYEFEYRMISSAGETVWLHDLVSVVCNKGNPKLLRGFMIDITERKRSEEDLRISEAKYRDLYDSAPDMFYSVDLKTGKILHCNRAMRRRTGYSQEELIGRPILELYDPACHDDALRAFESLKETGEARDVEMRVKRKDGSWLDVSLNVSGVWDDEGKLLYSRAAWRDITERKRAEEALRRSESDLRKSQQDLQALAGKLLSAQEEERARLARELHDDLTQRLAVLAIESGRLEQELASCCPPVSERVAAMKEQMVQLSGDIHRMSRQLHPSILDDLGLVDAIEAECSAFSEREGIDVDFRSQNVPRALAKEVALCLYRVTQESLRNIARHAQATEASVTLRGEDGRVELAVEDSGVGFDPGKVANRRGLGLASMEERVRLLQGRLSVRSRPGRGTLVEVHAPLTGGRHAAAAGAVGRRS